ASLMGEPLLSGSSSNTTVTLPDGRTSDQYFSRVGPEYFATMAIPLVAGRAIDARDRMETPRVLVVNETAASTMFGRESPLGRRLKIFGVSTEIVGVVRDTKYDSARKAAPPTVFLPYLQTSTPITLGAMYVVARTAMPPAAAMGALRAAAADVDRDV